MPLYRVTFQTSLLVEAHDELEATSIGFENLGDEVSNRSSELWRIESLESIDQLRREERGSLPWRSTERRDEPELRVEEILG